MLFGQLQVCGVTLCNLEVKEELLNYFDFYRILPPAKTQTQSLWICVHLFSIWGVILVYSVQSFG